VPSLKLGKIVMLIFVFETAEMNVIFYIQVEQPHDEELIHQIISPSPKVHTPLSSKFFKSKMILSADFFFIVDLIF